jgi:dihydroorotate dehydrogenase electron transfer subunit
MPASVTDHPSPPHPSRGEFVATVHENLPLCLEHFRLVLRLPSFPATEPGQFIQLQCRDGDRDYEPDRQRDWQPGTPRGEADDELYGPLALLRRPFSLAGRRDHADGVDLEVIHRVVGVGTDWLSRLSPGQRVHLIGPLGNRFQVPCEDELAILVGGGVGIPPMLYLAEKLAGRRAVGFSGALTRDLLPLTINKAAKPSSGEETIPALIIEEFARHGIPSVVTTDDGSFGFRGFVTQALERYLDRNQTPAVIYTCGPEPMMKRVAEIAAARGIECQIAVERAMACGMGTCQSCCIRVKKPDPAQPPLPGKDWCYRLACTDGPVFRGTELLW